MGRGATEPTTRSAPEGEALLREFARLLRERYGARLYLFGSRVRGDTRSDSDYDLVVVSSAFAEHPRFMRAPDQWRLWSEAGGWGIPLDLQCYTPEEFRRQLRGLGYLGQASRRGELVEVLPSLSDEALAPSAR